PDGPHSVHSGYPQAASVSRETPCGRGWPPVDDGWETPAVRGYQGHARNAAAMWEALARGHGVVLVGTERVRIVAPAAYHALRAIILDPVTEWPDTVQSIVDTVLARSSFSRRVVEDA